MRRWNENSIDDSAVFPSKHWRQQQRVWLTRTSRCQERPVFINRYRRADDYVTISATSAARREEAEQRAAQAKKENQRGLMVRGFRAYREEQSHGLSRL